MNSMEKTNRMLQVGQHTEDVLGPSLTPYSQLGFLETARRIEESVVPIGQMGVGPHEW